MLRWNFQPFLFSNIFLSISRYNFSCIPQVMICVYFLFRDKYFLVSCNFFDLLFIQQHSTQIFFILTMCQGFFYTFGIYQLKLIYKDIYDSKAVGTCPYFFALSLRSLAGILMYANVFLQFST